MGLFVAEPSAGAVTDVIAILLARRGMQLSQLSELRTDLETATIELAVARLDEGGRRRIVDALDGEAAAEDPAEAVHDLHAAIASTTANRVIELVALVLIRLSRLYQVERLEKRDIKKIRAEIHRSHTAIADAVLVGDAALARHRMQRHMTALASIVR